MKLALVGATGLVGREMIDVLSETNLGETDFFPVASKRSKDIQISYKNKKYSVITIEELINKKPDLALFSAGSEVSKKWAPKLASIGCTVIDNSSFWRMSSDHKLIIPEINGLVLKKTDKIIANPNCSTIQLLMVLFPLHKKYHIDRVIVSTYQAVSGTGKKAVEQLKNEEVGVLKEMAYEHQIFRNVIPKCDSFLENGYTKEEMKITNETKKILDKNINISSTAVRVPVLRGHSESVNITFKREFELEDIYPLLEQAPGVTVYDSPDNNKYPMPILARKKNDVFVGRIRKDFSLKNSLNLWIVSDNLRKGAATNTIQIAEFIIKNKFIQ